MKKTKESDAANARGRRGFAKTLAAAVIAAPVAARTARPQTPPAREEPKAPPNPQPAPAQQQPPRPSPAAEAYTEVARARFGEHLGEEDLNRLKRELEGNVRTADRLRAFKLKNSDEPDFVFGA